MNRLITYSIVVILVTIPAVLLARTLIVTETDQLEQLLGSLEEARFDDLLAAAVFDDGGLVVSAGSSTERFQIGEQERARALLESETGIGAGERVRLRQRQVDVRERDATAILNVEVGQGSYVALRINFSRRSDNWRVERIRVMG
jgi:hypothetical protein